MPVGREMVVAKEWKGAGGGQSLGRKEGRGEESRYMAEVEEREQRRASCGVSWGKGK